MNEQPSNCLLMDEILAAAAATAEAAAGKYSKQLPTFSGPLFPIQMVTGWNQGVEQLLFRSLSVCLSLAQERN